MKNPFFCKQLPSQELLRACFSYDEAGLLLRRGVAAGSLGKRGYNYICFQGTKYITHRLLWVFHNGSIPDGFEIDHIDGDRRNNRIENLRLATRAQQNYNRSVHRNCISGLKGAHFGGKRRLTFSKPWHSQITIAGEVIFLGHFATAQEAHEAYVVAAAERCGGFARVA